MNVLVFLVLRVLHVLIAAIWIGSNVFISAMLMPAISQSGPSGGQVMMRMHRGITAFMGALGAATILTGVYLFWHFTGGFDAGVSASHSGLAFGIGGISGILAGVVGGGVVGRSAAKAGRVVGQIGATPDGPVKEALLRHAAALRERIKIGGRIVLLLQTIALVLMAVGHYV